MVRGPEKDPLVGLEQANATTTLQHSSKESNESIETGAFEDVRKEEEEGTGVNSLTKADTVKDDITTVSAEGQSRSFLTENSPPVTTPSCDKHGKPQGENWKEKKTTLAWVSRGGGVLNGPQKPKGVSPSNTHPLKSLIKLRKLEQGRRMCAQL